MEKIIWPNMGEMSAGVKSADPYEVIDRNIGNISEEALLDGESLSRVTTFREDVADVNVAERIPEDKIRRRLGVEEGEEKRPWYEGKLIFFKTVGGAVSTAAFFAGIWALIKQPWKEPVLQDRRVDNWLNQMGWVFEGREDLNGGRQIMNMLVASKTKDINYNDRTTWGYYTGIADKFWKGGNNFGESARIVVSWSEKLMTHDDRQELIKTAGDNSKGILKFDEIMTQKEQQTGQKTEWTGVEQVLKENFGLEQRYLDVVRELRKEYYTGDGNLREAITNAEKSSYLKTLTTQQQVSLTEQRTEQRLEEARELISITGVGERVDAETVLQIAASFPAYTTETEAIGAMNEIFLDYPRMEQIESVGIPEIPPYVPQPPFKIENVQPGLMMGITVGFLARETPRYHRWAVEQLRRLGLSIPVVRNLLVKKENEI